jgi:hypothetical protein
MAGSPFLAVEIEKAIVAQGLCAQHVFDAVHEPGQDSGCEDSVLLRFIDENLLQILFNDSFSRRQFQGSSELSYCIVNPTLRHLN